MSKGSSIALLEWAEEPTCAGLGVLTVDRMAKRTNLPLASVDVKARVADRIGEVQITQCFQNPYTEHLEAVYIFPLSAGAAVSKYTMRVGTRVIVGRVDERAQARQQYAQAIQQGQRAALLEQERDDVFTVQVGNIPPGEEVVVELTYSERLPFFADGTTEIRLPLVVAPRYMAGNELARNDVGYGTASDTNLVPDASRISPPRLAPGSESKVALNVSVELIHANDGQHGGLADLKCSQHAVQSVSGDGATNISLSEEKERLNRDFVLRWRLAEEKLRSTFVYIKDPESDWHYGMLSLVPPSSKQNTEQARDVIFVIDRSGSMQGVKMTSAARACAIVLNTLGPSDRFAIQAFDNTCEWMNFVPPVVSSNDWWSDAAAAESSGYRGLGRCLVPANEHGIRQGLNYLRSIDARGGTETGLAMESALDLLDDVGITPNRVPVIVLITDGEIGAEANVLAGVQRRIGKTRVFTVGVDTAVNEGFLKRLAALGKGTCTFVEPGLKLEAALVNVGREIGAPLVTDLKITDDGAAIDAATIVPAHIPDLFVARASSCFFKFKLKNGLMPGKKSGPKPNIKLTGRHSGGTQFSAEIKGTEVPLNAVAQLWAKNYIDELEDQFRVGTRDRDRLKQEIVGVSIKHSVLCKFTAFVVVDESEIVNKTGDSRTVVQPVETPDQWSANQALPRSAGSLMGQLVRSNAPMQQNLAKFSMDAAAFGSGTDSWGAAPAPQPSAEPVPPMAPRYAQPPLGSGWGNAPGSAGAPSCPPPSLPSFGAGSNSPSVPDPSWGKPSGGNQGLDADLETGTWRGASQPEPQQQAAATSNAWGSAPIRQKATNANEKAAMQPEQTEADTQEPLTLAESIRRKVAAASVDQLAATSSESSAPNVVENQSIQSQREPQLAGSSTTEPASAVVHEELVKRYNEFSQAFEKAVLAIQQRRRDTTDAERIILAFLQYLRLMPKDHLAVILMHEFVLNHAASFMGVFTNTSPAAQMRITAYGVPMWQEIKTGFEKWLTDNFPD